MTAAKHEQPFREAHSPLVRHHETRAVWQSLPASAGYPPSPNGRATCALPCALHGRNSASERSVRLSRKQNAFGLMGRNSSSRQMLLTAAGDLLWEKSYHSLAI